MTLRRYQSLTARGQARRLRRLAISALAEYDLDVAKLSLVTNSFNGIFRIDTCSGEKYILRVTLPEGGHTRDHVAGEMAWLSDLASRTNLSIPCPLAARNGDMTVEVSAPGVPEPRLVEVFSWVPGTNLADHITPLNLSRLGRLLAELHRYALDFTPPIHLTLLVYDRLFPFCDPVLLFDESFKTIVPPERRRVFEIALELGQSVLNRLISSGEKMRIIHNDLHQWNIRIHRGILSPIDFEDLMWGWPVQDIATSLYYFNDREDYPALLAAFRSGYTSLSPWPERYVGEINALIGVRALDLANFILRDTNPYWHAKAGEFLEQTEHQLRKLLEDQTPNKIPPR